MSRSQQRNRTAQAFSLIEVVIALGIVSFAIVAILGLLPTGLTTSRSSEDDTRATQIAKATFETIQAEATKNFSSINLLLDDGKSVPPFDLSKSDNSTTPSFYADNDGKSLSSSGNTAPAGARYAIFVTTNNSPSGFDAGVGNEITIKIAWPAAAPKLKQSYRNFVWIVSKY